MKTHSLVTGKINKDQDKQMIRLVPDQQVELEAIRRFVPPILIWICRFLPQLALVLRVSWIMNGLAAKIRWVMVGWLMAEVASIPGRVYISRRAWPEDRLETRVERSFRILGLILPIEVFLGSVAYYIVASIIVNIELAWFSPESSVLLTVPTSPLALWGIYLRRPPKPLQSASSHTCKESSESNENTFDDESSERDGESDEEEFFSAKSDQE